MNYFRKISLLLLLTIILTTGCKTYFSHEELEKDDLSMFRGKTDKLVVVQSRTGNTATLAMTISESLKTDYIRLDVKTESYFSVPGRHDDVPVKHDKINLKRYKMLFIGSPIWAYYPTAYMYSFIKKTDLSGKKVVLFYTFRGGINDDAIPELKKLVASKGGKVIDVIRINCKTLGEKTVKDAAIELVEKRKRYWK